MCDINVFFMHRHAAEKMMIQKQKKAFICQYEKMARYILDFKQLRGGRVEGGGEGVGKKNTQFLNRDILAS